MARGVSFIVTTVSTTVSATYRKAQAFINSLSSAVSGVGASFVGVADAGGYFTGTTLESVLAELGILTSKIITDPGNGGAIPVTRSGCVALVTTAAQTRTLAAPTFVNQQLCLYFKTDGGDCVITVSGGIDLVSHTTITLTTVDDFVYLVGAYNGTALRWRLAATNGAVNIT